MWGKAEMSEGCVQVYTGNGKGKTTAAIGLAVRAAGAGLRVFIAQFVKKRKCSEHRALEVFRDNITIRMFGGGFILGRNPEPEDIEAAHRGYLASRDAVLSGEYDLVILDEANVAVHRGLMPVSDLLWLIKERPSHVELVITGRFADELVLEAADLVTEMKEIKHYARRGVKARCGMEY